VVRPGTIARVHPAWQGRPRGPFPHTKPGQGADGKIPYKLRVEWIGARVAVGMWAGYFESWLGWSAFGELTLFTLRWRHFYWEILRGGGGLPLIGYWGTALGYPFDLDDQGRHELRLGIHITLWYGYVPSASGVQLYYMYRPSHRLGLQIGLMQTSYPFTLALTVGISM
jgi:hypothetical protein